MKTSVWLIILTAIVAAIVGYLYVKPKLVAKKTTYLFTVLKRGDIEANISSTGTLEAINTVEVGTQISGTITQIHADYNDQVVAGQLLAEMDVKLLKTALQNAQANLSGIEAQLHQAYDEFKRNQALFKKKVITQKQFNDSKYRYEQFISSKKAAEASVNSAEVNLEYANITSPINGTITERSVEEGQTVAASFSTPTLFIIAEDLSNMQILADVDESDIGYIHHGMNVRFTVQTYPDKKFYGAVSQIRLQPIEINNVVNYQVVINADNESGVLLPGMTTNLEFITEKAQNAMLVNNSALRFRPTEAMLKAIKPTLIEKTERIMPDSIKGPFLESIDNEELYTPANFKKALPSQINGFFYTNEKGRLDFMFVETGIKTGLQSEITHFLDSAEFSAAQKAINGVKTK